MMAAGPPEIAAEEVVVGLSIAHLTHDFMVGLQDQFSQCVEEYGWTLLAPVNANNDAEKQHGDIENLLSLGANVLVYAAVDSAAIVPSIEAANEKGIPVFEFDTRSFGGEDVVTVRANNFLAGQLAAEEMVRRLEEKPCWPECKVLELQGGLNTQNGRDRSEGFQDVMKEYPDITLISRPTDWVAENGARETQDVVSANKDIVGIYTPSELFNASVLAVLDQAGLEAPVGEEGHVVLISIDGTTAALEQIRSDELDATVSQPLSGYAQVTCDLIQQQVVEGQALEPGEAENGEIITTDIGHEYQIPATLVTKDNVDDPSLWGNMMAQ
jgi:ABC-type sugar transport system substrate-binding protein